MKYLIKTEICFRHATASVCSGQKLVHTEPYYAKYIDLLTLECCRKFILGLLIWSENIIYFLYTLNHKKSSGLRNQSQ